jgi:hypothetical protein
LSTDSTPAARSAAGAAADGYLGKRKSTYNIIVLMETIKALYISAQTPTVPSAPSCRHERQPRFLVSHLVGNRAAYPKNNGLLKTIS